MSSENLTEKPTKKRNIKRILLKAFIILEILAFISVFVMFILAVATPDFDQSFVFAEIGGIIIGSMVGSLMLFMAIFGIRSILKAKNLGFGTNITTSDFSQTDKLEPYKTTKQRNWYCEYCGYEVTRKERECPKCGGPIIRDKK